MTLQQACEQCGTNNHGSKPKSPGLALHRVVEFECGSCGATGEVKVHSDAGVLGRSGQYFEGDG